jgi:hypothetical protein
VRQTLSLFFFSFLFLTLTKPLLASPEDCNRLLTYWRLPPKAQSLVTGVLAETDSKKQIIVVSDYYWGRHDAMEEELRQKFPIKRILWMGEILLVNPETEDSNAIMTLSINTAGHWKTKLMQTGLIDINNPLQLRDSLMNFRPDLRSPHSLYYYYSDEYAHLDPFLQRLHEQHLHEKGGFNDNDSARHRFRDLLMVMYALCKYLNKPDISWANQFNRITSVSPDTIDKLVHYFESRSRFSGSTLTPQEHLLPNKPVRTEEDFRRLVDLIKSHSSNVNSTDVTTETLVLNP